MAGIDKVYGTYEQYLELREWLCTVNQKFACQVGWSINGAKEYEMRHPLDYLYEHDKFDGEMPLSNFPELIDRWLAKNCPIEFVRKRLAEQGYVVIEAP